MSAQYDDVSEGERHVGIGISCGIGMAAIYSAVSIASYIAQGVVYASPNVDATFIVAPRQALFAVIVPVICFLLLGLTGGLCWGVVARRGLMRIMPAPIWISAALWFSFFAGLTVANIVAVHALLAALDVGRYLAFFAMGLLVSPFFSKSVLTALSLLNEVSSENWEEKKISEHSVEKDDRFITK